MFILDTDHIGVLQRQSGSLYQTLAQRMAQTAATDFYVAIVSFHEQILGWNAYIARAKDQAGIVRGYGKLEKILTDFAQAQVLPFDSAAADVFEDLRRQRVRVATMDLRIASIALAAGMAVLTRNLVDFKKSPISKRRTGRSNG